MTSREDTILLLDSEPDWFAGATAEGGLPLTDSRKKILYWSCGDAKL